MLIIVVIFSCFLSGCAVSLQTSESRGAKYEINATYDSESATLTGSAVICYKHFGESTLNELCFNLYANAYTNSGGENRIESVYLDGKKAPFSLVGEQNNILKIPLMRELYPDEEVETSINYTLTIPQKEGRFGASGDTVRLSGWYPQLCVLNDGVWSEYNVESVGDYFYSDCADYTVRLTVDKDMVVASSGKRTATVESENTKTHTFEGYSIRDFAFALSTKYEVVSAVCGSTLISCYAFSEEECEKLIPYAQKSFNLFSEKYGKYPHPTYSVALCETQSGGMEFSGLVYVSRDLEESELERVVAHETAHQWWYSGVGSNPNEEAWLDEGLAEFSTFEYIEEVYGVLERKKIVNERELAYSSFCSVIKNIKGVSDLPMNRKLSEFASEYEYVLVTYYKGELFFENLKAILGGKRFDSALKKYYSSFSGKVTDSDGLIYSLKEVGNLSVEPIFEAWERGKVYFGS